MKTYISINKCPIHNVYSISIDDADGCGTRITPSKCCGQWKEVCKWEINERIINNVTNNITKSRHKFTD